MRLDKPAGTAKIFHHQKGGGGGGGYVRTANPTIVIWLVYYCMVVGFAVSLSNCNVLSAQKKSST